MQSQVRDTVTVIGDRSILYWSIKEKKIYETIRPKSPFVRLLIASMKLIIYSYRFHNFRRFVSV